MEGSIGEAVDAGDGEAVPREEAFELFQRGLAGEFFGGGGGEAQAERVGDVRRHARLDRQRVALDRAADLGEVFAGMDV